MNQLRLPSSFPIVRYTILAAFMFVVVPAIALAAKAEKVSGLDRSFVVGQEEMAPSGFSEEDRAVLVKHLKTTKKSKNADPYLIGYHLPDHVGYKTLPAKISKKVEPAPAGYKAVRVGNQVLLISEMSRRIVDRVAL